MIGPLQLVVIGFDEGKYALDVVLELKNPRKQRSIGIFDLLYIFEHLWAKGFKETVLKTSGTIRGSIIPRALWPAAC